MYVCSIFIAIANILSFSLEANFKSAYDQRVDRIHGVLFQKVVNK